MASEIANDTVVCVGELAGAAATNGGGATKTAWDAGTYTDFMTATEGPVDTAAGAAITNNGGECRITSAGNFTNTVAGTVVALDNFSGGLYTNSRVEVTARNDNYIDVDFAYDTDQTCDVVVGGAFATSGLQAVFDDADVGDPLGPGAFYYDREIRINADTTTTTTIDIDTYTSDTGKYIKFIGCNSSFIPYTTADYVTFDAGAAPGLNGTAFFNIEVGNTWIENILVYHPGGTGETPVAGEYGFYISTNTTYGHIFKNCKAQKCYVGYYTGSEGRDTLLLDCINIGSSNSSVYNTAYGVVIKGGFYRTANVGIENIYSRGSCFLSNVIIEGGTYGVWADVTYACTVINCSFYDQRNACIGVADVNCFTVIMNNIMYLNDAVNDFAIDLAIAGRYYEDFNITNATSAHSGFNGDSSSLAGVTFTNTDPYTSASTGDFTINITGTAGAQCLDSGWTPPGSSTLAAAGLSTIGAYQLTQTQSGSTSTAAQTGYRARYKFSST